MPIILQLSCFVEAPEEVPGHGSNKTKKVIPPRRTQTPFAFSYNLGPESTVSEVIQYLHDFVERRLHSRLFKPVLFSVLSNPQTDSINPTETALRRPNQEKELFRRRTLHIPFMVEASSSGSTSGTHPRGIRAMREEHEGEGRANPPHASNHNHNNNNNKSNKRVSSILRRETRRGEERITHGNANHSEWALCIRDADGVYRYGGNAKVKKVKSHSPTKKKKKKQKSASSSSLRFNFTRKKKSELEEAELDANGQDLVVVDGGSEPASGERMEKKEKKKEKKRFFSRKQKKKEKKNRDQGELVLPLDENHIEKMVSVNPTEVKGRRKHRRGKHHDISKEMDSILRFPFIPQLCLTSHAKLMALQPEIWRHERSITVGASWPVDSTSPGKKEGPLREDSIDLEGAQMTPLLMEKMKTSFFLSSESSEFELKFAVINAVVLPMSWLVALNPKPSMSDPAPKEHSPLGDLPEDGHAPNTSEDPSNHNSSKGKSKKHHFFSPRHTTSSNDPPLRLFQPVQVPLELVLNTFRDCEGDGTSPPSPNREETTQYTKAPIPQEEEERRKHQLAPSSPPPDDSTVRSPAVSSTNGKHADGPLVEILEGTSATTLPQQEDAAPTEKETGTGSESNSVAVDCGPSNPPSARVAPSAEERKEEEKEKSRLPSVFETIEGDGYEREDTEALPSPPPHRIDAQTVWYLPSDLWERGNPNNSNGREEWKSEEGTLLWQYASCILQHREMCQRIDRLRSPDRNPENTEDDYRLHQLMKRKLELEADIKENHDRWRVSADDYHGRLGEAYRQAAREEEAAHQVSMLEERLLESKARQEELLLMIDQL